MMNEQELKKKSEEERLRRMREGEEGMPTSPTEGAQETPEDRLARELEEERSREGAVSGATPARQLEERPQEAATSEELRLRQETLGRTAPATDQPFRREPEVTAPVRGGMETTQREREQAVRRAPGEFRTEGPSGTGSYYSQAPERPVGRASPESYFGEGTQPQAAGQGMPPAQGARRIGMDESKYPPGSGSYYSETFEKPVGTAGPESYFGRVEGEPRATRAPMTAQQPASRYSMDESRYPAGSGSYYTETKERPTGTVGPESYFGRVEGEPREVPRQYAAPAAGMTAPAQPRMTEAAGMGERVGAAVAPVTTKAKEVGGQFAQRAETIDQPGKAEDTAHHTGVIIGKAFKKASRVIREFGSGLDRGLRDEQRNEGESTSRQSEEQTTQETRRVETKKRENP